VGRWRAAHPEAVERLETLDRDTGPAPPGPPREPWRTTPPGGRDGSDPRAALNDGATRDARQPSAAASEAPARAARERSRRRSIDPPRRDDAAAPTPSPLDVNRATEDELMQLPGVGPVLAARIVAARAAVGQFGAVDDLRRVPGLGRGRIDALRRFLVTSP